MDHKKLKEYYRQLVINDNTGRYKDFDINNIEYEDQTVNSTNVTNNNQSPEDELAQVWNNAIQ